jgi:hypothetical protein
MLYNEVRSLERLIKLMVIISNNPFTLGFQGQARSFFVIILFMTCIDPFLFLIFQSFLWHGAMMYC